MLLISFKQFPASLLSPPHQSELFPTPSFVPENLKLRTSYHQQHPARITPKKTCYLFTMMQCYHRISGRPSRLESSFLAFGQQKKFAAESVTHKTGDDDQNYYTQMCNKAMMKSVDDENVTCKWWNLHSSWEFPLHGTHGWGRQSEAKLRFLPGLKKLCITGSGTYYLCLTQNGEMKLREGKIFLMCWK